MAEEPLSGPAGSRDRPQDIGLPEIPGYRIEETLGRGSTGVVYRATQLAVDRQVALKVLHPDLAGRPRAVRRLQREARTTARLAHPNIVSAIDMGQVGALWWYAMELVEGESLAARLERVARLGEREALRLFTPLVDALDHAQRQGVVHRDIKPANILIDTAGRARLVDLGLAFREDDPLITSPGSTLGTPHYVSPEQARNPEAADTRSDIWSLGATLYHAVCGRPPFPGSSVAEILSGVLYGRVTDPRRLEPSLSRGLALVLRKCLTRDPAGRYATPHELLEDLERLREKRPVAVQVSRLDPVRARGGWRARLPWVAAAVAVLAVGGWLARDVLAPADEAPPAPAVVEAPWPELEALARAARRPGAAPAPALVELAALAPVPSRHRARYEQVEEQLVSRLRDAQAAFTRRLQVEVDRLVAQRDFVGALALVSSKGFGARARRELQVDAVQLAQLERSVRPQELRSGVEAELEAHAAELARRARAHMSQVLQARVDNDVDAGLWRDAYEELSREPLRQLADAGLVTAGLPPPRLEALLTELRADLEARRDELEARWRRLDQELARWIDEQSARLEEDLRARLPRTVPASVELAELYERRCAELKVLDGQRLEVASAEAADALERHLGELVALERALIGEDAAVWLAGAQEQARALRVARRYDELADQWARALEHAWLEPVHAEVELELRAAQLVQGLLEAAARGLRERNGQTLGLLVRSIEVSGRLDAGSAPLDRPFGLVAPDVGTVALALRPPADATSGARPYVLPPEAVERFAGLPPDAARTPAIEDLLARALLRHYEGDTAGALACLPLPRSGDPLLDALGARLAERVSRRDDELQRERTRRLEEAEAAVHVALRMAGEARHAGDREAALRSIDDLLQRYGDLEPVRARADELRRLRAALAPGGPPGEEDFQEGFGPSAVELAGDEVRMEFDFGPAYAGRWSRGAWREDAEGWIARGPHSLDDVLGATGWPRLLLGPPLDLDGPLEVRFTFEQPQDSGQPRLLVASVAGVHVVLRGEQGSEPARMAVGAGGPEEMRRLIESVDGGGEGRAFAGLARGERYTLSVDLTRQRGRAVVRLWGRAPSGEDFDGRELELLQAPRPEGKPGTASLVLRSIEPVRLLEASVRGRPVSSY